MLDPAESETSKKKKLVTIPTATISSKQRSNFVLDFTQMMVAADIPLEKTSKLKPFLVKYCKQGGTLPQNKTLRTDYVPKLYTEHVEQLKKLLKDEPVAIVADETTDVRDHSILNVLAIVRGKSYLIDVITLTACNLTLTACNHQTLSRGIVSAVQAMEIDDGNVTAIITDSAAYCKKAFKDVLSVLYPNATQILCLAHVLNLAGEVFQKWPAFGRLATFVSMVKSAFNKKASRKARFLAYLGEYLPANLVSLPPVPCSTRWNTWFYAVIYHAARIHVYHGFFNVEASKGIAVESIIEMLANKDIYLELRLQSSFVVENCKRLPHQSRGHVPTTHS